MQIEIFKIEENVKLKIDGEDKNFEFTTIDELIDRFIEINPEDFHIKCDDETLSNYKKLIQNVFEETKKTEFINAYRSLKRTELTNDEIVKIIEDKK